MCLLYSARKNWWLRFVIKYPLVYKQKLQFLHPRQTLLLMVIISICCYSMHFLPNLPDSPQVEHFANLKTNINTIHKAYSIYYYCICCHNLAQNANSRKCFVVAEAKFSWFCSILCHIMLTFSKKFNLFIQKVHNWESLN